MVATTRDRAVWVTPRYVIQTAKDIEGLARIGWGLKSIIFS